MQGTPSWWIVAGQLTALVHTKTGQSFFGCISYTTVMQTVKPDITLAKLRRPGALHCTLAGSSLILNHVPTP